MNATSNYNRGYQQPMTGGFQGSPMNGFQGMGGAQSFGGFQNRGGMMGNMRGGSVGMRGGRGGMNGNGMMAMPMGGMGMGNMGTQMGGIGMGMPQMAAGMGMQGMQSFQKILSLRLGPDGIRTRVRVLLRRPMTSIPMAVQTRLGRGPTALATHSSQPAVIPLLAPLIGSIRLQLLPSRLLINRAVH